MKQITSIIISIRNIMWQNEGVDGNAPQIPQMDWIFFMNLYYKNRKELVLRNNSIPQEQ